MEMANHILLQNSENLTLTDWPDYTPSTVRHSENMSRENFSQMPVLLRCGENVHDKEYNRKVRIAILYVTILLGTFGGLLVFVWMWKNRRLKSRVNQLILNLTTADLMVMLLAALPQLTWEYQDQRGWYAGEFVCKTVKFCQSFTLMASTNMLVAIAVDRHQAITRPLKTPFAVWKMAGVAWIMAAVASFPMFYVFRLNTSVNGVPKCENIFRGKPVHHRQAFITYAAIMVFVIPLVILSVSYIRIFLTIARKTKINKTKNRKPSLKPGKVYLQCTGSKSFPKAKIKTLKMTFVIVLVYILCGVPYFIGDMVMSYGSPCALSMLVYGVLGGLAAANSAANPFVFLMFNINRKATYDTRRTFSDGGGTFRTFIYSTASTRSSNMNDAKLPQHGPLKSKRYRASTTSVTQ